MSGALFWAQGSQTVKTATGFRPVVAEVSPKLPKAATEPKKSLLSKRTANGIAKTTLPIPQAKKTNWADSDDDDEFLASFINNATNPRAQELECAVAARDSRINELVTTLAARDGRVDDLEGLLKEKDRRIADLKTDVEVKCARIGELQAENEKQHLQLQELTTEINEKGRYINKLGQQLNEKTATICEPEMDSKSYTQMSTEDTDTAVATPESTEIEPGGSQVTDRSKNTPTKDVPEGPQGIDSPREATGPAANLAKFPRYILPGTARSLPPPPPAPKLKMGIDLSKFGKKTIFKPVEPKKTSDLPIVMSSHDYSSKQRLETDVVPKINPAIDVRTLKHTERVLFANGPKVAVMMGDKRLATLPNYILMQCSWTANQYLTENPNATTIMFEAKSMDADAAKAHLRWMNEMTFQGRVYSLTLNSSEQNDAKNLNICRAARVLGLNNIYVGHFTRIFCDRLRSQKASVVFMSLVAEVAYPENDPIFECLAHNLANMHVRGIIRKDLNAALLEKHANLKGKVEQIEKRITDKRKSEKKGSSGKRSSVPK